MKRFLKGTALVVIGFALGMAAMGYLSMRASETFMRIVRQHYDTEQRIMAVRAKKAGQPDKAVLHYRNMLSVSSSPGLRTFDKTHEAWDFFFPFRALILERIRAEIATPSSEEAGLRVQRANEGIYHGLLADALKRAGRTEEAREHYVIAAKLMGWDDETSGMRSFIEKILSSEDLLLGASDQYAYPEEHE